MPIFSLKGINPMSDLHKSRERLYRQKKWLTLRKKHLARFDKCIVCGSKENLHVDHRETTKLNINRFFDPTNLQTLCITHHSQKTALERGHVRERAVDDEGYPILDTHPWVK